MASNNWLYYAIAGVAGYFLYEKYFAPGASASVASPVATPVAATGPVSSAVASPIAIGPVSAAVAMPATPVLPGSQPEPIGYQETWYGNDPSGQQSAQAAGSVHGGTWQVNSVSPNTSGQTGSQYQVVVQRIS